MTKQMIGTFLSAVALTAAAAPELKDYTVEQNADRMVVVSFTLTEKAILTMDVLTNGVSIGAENYQTVRDAMSNDDTFPANKVVPAGSHVFTWRPVKEWPGYSFDKGELSVEVKAWSFDSPPDYMVLDSGSISNFPAFYATAADLPGGIKTADPEDADAVAALKNDPYRTTKIVMRKIPAAGVKWRMGSPEDEAYRRSNETPHYVTLTNDYYVSIYPMTFTQINKFCSGEETPSVNPKHNTRYSDMRGSTYSWPEDGYNVGGRFAALRKRLGLRMDFLTEAEWEYACRAGTEGRWNHDGTTPDAVAWTGYTGGAKSHAVGLKLPNRWGLYDMHGLVNEWVLDRLGQYPTDAVIAPVGATGDEVKRVLRGGPQGIKWSDSVGYNKSPQISTRSAYRGSAKPDSSYDGNTNGYGIRLSCPASLPEWMRK